MGNIRRTLNCVVGIATLAAGQLASSEAPQYQVKSIAVPTVRSGWAASINNAGEVLVNAVMQERNGESNVHAYVYRNGALQEVVGLGGSATVGNDINDSGQVTGTSQIAGGGVQDQHAFVSSGGIASDLGTLGGILSWGSGINSAGDVTGYSYSTATPPTPRCFVYRDNQMSDIGGLGGTGCIGFAINDFGQIIGGGGTATDERARAFLYDAESVIDLGSLGGTPEYPWQEWSRGNDINNRGEVVGSALTENGATHTFLYRDGSMIDLGAVAGNYSEGLGINEHSEVVGRSLSPQGATVAFVYADGRMVDLNTVIASRALDGRTLDEAVEINDVGQIIANSAAGQAFLLTPLPNVFKRLSADAWAVGKDALSVWVDIGRANYEALDTEGACEALNLFDLEVTARRKAIARDVAVELLQSSEEIREALACREG